MTLELLEAAADLAHQVAGGEADLGVAGTSRSQDVDAHVLSFNDDVLTYGPLWTLSRD